MAMSRGNLRRIAALAADAGAEADVVVFPEACLSGYFLEGGVSEAARSAEQVAEGLGPAGERSPDVVVGFMSDGGDGFTTASCIWKSSRGATSLGTFIGKCFCPRTASSTRALRGARHRGPRLRHEIRASWYARL